MSCVWVSRYKSETTGTAHMHTAIMRRLWGWLPCPYPPTPSRGYCARSSAQISAFTSPSTCSVDDLRRSASSLAPMFEETVTLPTPMEDGEPVE